MGLSPFKAESFTVGAIHNFILGVKLGFRQAQGQATDTKVGFSHSGMSNTRKITKIGLFLIVACLEQHFSAISREMEA